MTLRLYVNPLYTNLEWLGQCIPCIEIVLLIPCETTIRIGTVIIHGLDVPVVGIIKAVASGKRQPVGHLVGKISPAAIGISGASIVCHVQVVAQEVPSNTLTGPELALQKEQTNIILQLASNKPTICFLGRILPIICMAITATDGEHVAFSKDPAIEAYPCQHPRHTILVGSIGTTVLH